MDSKPPFFILANPRSGSSLLRIMCDSNKNLCVPPESGFLEWWYPTYKNWSQADSQSKTTIKRYCDDLVSSKKFETWHYDISLLKKAIHETSPKNYADLTALVYTTYAMQQGKTEVVWGDKNNYYISKTALLNTLYPQAKYIHLIRDGRDVATSYQAIKKLKTTSEYVPKLSTDIATIAKEWKDNNEHLSNFAIQLSNENYLCVAYEDLIKDAKGTCQKICKFLGVSYDEEMLNYHTKEAKEPAKTLDWKKKTLEKPDVSNIEKYKKLLTPDEIATFTSIAGEALKNYGY